MKIIASAGREDVALVYIAEMDSGKLVECVESLQPPLPREEKWVLLVSTMFGCPVGCMMCDAGGYYEGKPSADDILAQIDYLVYQRFPDGAIPSRQFKIQFARMGEPSLNPAVLPVLEALPQRFRAPGLMPSLSTIAPYGTAGFFERLLEIKRALYTAGRFQFQFSIHTTDQAARDRLIPVKKWSFAQMAEYGERFYQPGDRKITLNFALADSSAAENGAAPIDAQVLLSYFSPEKFLIKITPLNPTYRALENRLSSHIDPTQTEREYAVVAALREAGYQVIVSIGEVEENFIGSNCGQFLRRHLSNPVPIPDGYTYQVLPY
jgi:23S rRNA (adenine2503-C2)-methyltransferase